MKLKVLGCGTSTGVPLVGCNCKVCCSNDPKNYRDRTSVYIELNEHEGILVDASTDLRQQALKHGVKHVETVLYTHGHADHILGTEDLRVFNFISKQSIPCYGLPATLATIRSTFGYLFGDNTNYQGGMLTQLTLNEIAPYEPLTLFRTEVIPFLLYHGKMEVLGYRIGELAYATDCNVIPEKSFEVLKGVRYLILDGLRHESHRTHFTISQSIDAAQKIGAEKTYLIHMTHSIDYHETNAELPEGIELAYDGLQIDFK